MTEPTPLRLRSPESLPTVVPHLLGFHPRSSLVMLGLHGSSQAVRITIRVDLPSVGESPRTYLAAWGASFAALGRAGADAVVLAVYPESWPGSVMPSPLPWRDVVEAIDEVLRAEGVRLADAVVIVGDRVASYLCDDPCCCPPDGRVVETAESLRLEAAFVEQGSAPLAGRECLAAQLEPRPADDAFRAEVDRVSGRVLSRLSSDLPRRTERFVTDLRAWDGDPRSETVFVRLVATVVWLVLGISSRDLLLRALTADGDRALLKSARSVLAEAVRCAEPEETAGLASVLAVCAWVDGDGAAAWTAIDHALAADPSYSLAGLVATALDTGTPPWVWTSMMGGLSEQEILAAVPRDPSSSPR